MFYMTHLINFIFFEKWPLEIDNVGVSDMKIVGKEFEFHNGADFGPGLEISDTEYFLSFLFALSFVCDTVNFMTAREWWGGDQLECCLTSNTPSTPSS